MAEHVHYGQVQSFWEPSVTYGGYKCANCGSWVPNGVSHQCAWPASRPAVPTNVDHGFRYAAALERIAAALEAIAKAGTPPPEEQT